jgi:hypothetical protein
VMVSGDGVSRLGRGKRADDGQGEDVGIMGNIQFAGLGLIAMILCGVTCSLLWRGVSRGFASYIFVAGFVSASVSRLLSGCDSATSELQQPRCGTVDAVQPL